mmetsp:Transcript_37155/g.93675  ORF Transcript_37155/g.93675 Transcript_37155/m.93675 type:complete len:245 (-) Transcript_37155:578-1312(-)
MASSASDCRRYLPPFLDTTTVTSCPLGYWKLMTLAPAAPPDVSDCATLAGAAAMTSSNTAVSWGGGRLMPTVTLYPAFLTGGMTLAKRHMGSAISRLCDRGSPPAVLKVATTSAVVEVGRRALDAGVNTSGTTTGSDGSLCTVRRNTLSWSTPTGSGALTVSVTLSALLEPPWYTRYTLTVSLRACRPELAARSSMSWPPARRLSNSAGTCARMSSLSGGSTRRPPACSRMMAASWRCSRPMAS